MSRKSVIIVFTACVVFMGCSAPSSQVSAQTRAQIKIKPSGNSTKAADGTYPCDWNDPDTFMGGGTNGYQQFKTVKADTPGRCKEAEDFDAEQAIAKIENRKAELFQALQTRVLTTAEMKEALGYGDSLNIPDNVEYSEDEKQKELNEAFVTQARLREIADEEKAQTSCGCPVAKGNQ